ncbi:hypothetical protein [Bradyrhizobium sp. 190]|uniref:hypothetical protein n=1 Tax=Bradyrhizobium sp. 190 TaxID=2782658 RepID=UPI001FF98DEC|nr:hypothetical protein [Bradyrhizobium sp. 190]
MNSAVENVMTFWPIATIGSGGLGCRKSAIGLNRSRGSALRPAAQPTRPHDRAGRRQRKPFVVESTATLAGDSNELGEGKEPATADVEGVRRLLEGEVLPWFENRRKNWPTGPLIRDPAFGDALDPNKLERLGRYEVHLDRKLERMLTMLLRLKHLRRTTVKPLGIGCAAWNTQDHCLSKIIALVRPVRGSHRLARWPGSCSR